MLIEGVSKAVCEDVSKADRRQASSSYAIAAEFKGDIDIDLSEHATRDSRQTLNSAGTLFTNIALRSGSGVEQLSSFFVWAWQVSTMLGSVEFIRSL